MEFDTDHIVVEANLVHWNRAAQTITVMVPAFENRAFIFTPDYLSVAYRDGVEIFTRYASQHDVFMVKVDMYMTVGKGLYQRWVDGWSLRDDDYHVHTMKGISI